MKINNAQTTFKPLRNHLESAEKELRKIASAKKVDGSDAAMMQIARVLMSDAGMMGQKVQNDNETIAMLQISEGVMQNLGESVQKLAILNVRAGSDLRSADQKAMLQKEFDAQKKAMNDMIESASFNGKKLFGSLLPSLDVSDLKLGESDTLDNFIQTLQAIQNDVGAKTNGFASEINSLLATRVNTLLAYSQIADTDIAKSVSEFKKENLLTQTALFAQAHSRDLDQERIKGLLR